MMSPACALKRRQDGERAAAATTRRRPLAVVVAAIANSTVPNARAGSVARTMRSSHQATLEPTLRPSTAMKGLRTRPPQLLLLLYPLKPQLFHPHRDDDDDGTAFWRKEVGAPADTAQGSSSSQFRHRKHSIVVRRIRQKTFFSYFGVLRCVLTEVRGSTIRLDTTTIRNWK